MAGILDVGKMVATLGLNTSPFMASANGAMQGMRQMQVQMMMTGRALTRFVSLPMAIAGVASIKMQKDFEMSMTKIVGLVGVSRQQVDAWKQDIYNIGRETGRGPKELADALYFVTSAGYRGEEALDILRRSAMAAAGGMGETKDIADLVTSAMYAYRKSNLSAVEAMDAVVASVREGKVEVTDLINSMGKVFPIASKFGVSINEVGAAFAAMTRSGTEADKASTHLRAILNQMMSPSEKVKKNLAGLAFGAEEFQDTLMKDGLIAALIKLNTAIKGSPKAYAEIFQNIRALTGVLDLMGDNMEENVRIFERMKDASGSLKKVFEEVQGTTQFGIDRALASLGISAIELGEAFKDPLIKILSILTKWIDAITERFSQMSDSQKEATIRIAGLVAVIGPAMAIISRLWMIIAANPIGALTIALLAAINLFVRWKKLANDVTVGEKAQQSVKEKTISLMNQEQIKVKALFDIVKDETKAMKDRKAALEELKGIAPDYFGNLDLEKTKMDKLTTSYKKYNEEALLKNTLSALTQLMSEHTQAIMKLNNEGAKIPQWQKFLWREAAGWDRINQSIANVRGEQYDMMTVQDRTNNVTEDQLRSHEQYLEIYKRMFKETMDEYVAFRAAMEEWKKEQENPVVPETGGLTDGGDIGGYLYNLQEDLKKAQEAALGVNKEDLAVALDKVRAAEQLIQLAQLQGKEYNRAGAIQRRIAEAQIKQVTANDEDWAILQKKIIAWQRLLGIIADSADGYGVLEQLGQDITDKEIEISNATEEELAALKEQLRVLQEKKAILEEIIDPYEAEQDFSKRGTKAWTEFNKKRIADLKGWLAAGKGTHAQQLAWSQEIFQREQDIRDLKLESVAQTFSAIQDFAGAMQGLYNAQMQAEIKAAKGNVAEQERIQKKYYQKQKKWAILAAVMNVAQGITKAIAQGGILGLITGLAVAAAGAIQIATISAQNFAKGGLVYGETLARVGEYPNAKSNPEVIAPLSDLKKLLKPQGEGMPKYIKLVLEGKDAVAMINMERLIQNTY